VEARRARTRSAAACAIAERGERGSSAAVRLKGAERGGDDAPEMTVAEDVVEFVGCLRARRVRGYPSVRPASFSFGILQG
jgi:hypothetical protein